MVWISYTQHWYPSPPPPHPAVLIGVSIPLSLPAVAAELMCSDFTCTCVTCMDCKYTLFIARYHIAIFPETDQSSLCAQWPADAKAVQGKCKAELFAGYCCALAYRLQLLCERQRHVLLLALLCSMPFLLCCALLCSSSDYPPPVLPGLCARRV